MGVGEFHSLYHFTAFFIHETYSDVKAIQNASQLGSGHMSVILVKENRSVN